METTILQAISTVGFPIVAFLLMFYQTSVTIKENTKAIRELIYHIKRR